MNESSRDKLRTIAICGSMTFAQEMLILRDQLVNLGWNVLVPNTLESESKPLDRRGPVFMQQKKWFIAEHFAKIARADAILVANYDKNGITGYIGSNTLMEIAVASFLQKEMYILQPVGEQSCRDEVEALATKILNGDVRQLVR